MDRKELEKRILDRLDEALKMARQQKEQYGIWANEAQVEIERLEQEKAALQLAFATEEQ